MTPSHWLAATAPPHKKSFVIPYLSSRSFSLYYLSKQPKTKSKILYTYPQILENVKKLCPTARKTSCYLP